MADYSNILSALMGAQPPTQNDPQNQMGGLFGAQSQSQKPYGILGALMAPPTLLDQTRQQYPLLKNYDIGYKNNIGGGQGYMESWPPGETGTPSAPRPQEFPPNQFGVENYRADSRPQDLAGDIVSHHLITADPKIKQAYQTFTGSLEPWQHDILQQQYQHAKANEGETRPYENWRDTSGLPAYFRGYTFQQWPDDFNKQAYTPQQTQALDSVMDYIKGGR